MSDPVVQYLRQEQTKLKIVERNKSAAIAKVDKLKSDIRQQERVLIEKRKRKVQLEKENMALNNCDQLQRAISMHSNDLAFTTRLKERVETNAKQLEKAVVEMQQTSEANTKKLDSLNQSTKRTAEALHKIKSKQERTQMEHNKLKANNQSIKEEIEKLKTARISVTAKISEAKKQISLATEEKNMLEKHLEETATENQRLKEKRRAKQKEISSMAADVASFKAGNKNVDMKNIVDRFGGDESKNDSLVFDVPLTTLSIAEIQIRIDAELKTQRKKNAKALKEQEKAARDTTNEATAKLKSEIKQLRQELDGLKKQGY